MDQSALDAVAWKNDGAGIPAGQCRLSAVEPQPTKLQGLAMTLVTLLLEEGLDVLAEIDPKLRRRGELRCLRPGAQQVPEAGPNLER